MPAIRSVLHTILSKEQIIQDVLLLIAWDGLLVAFAFYKQGTTGSEGADRTS